MKRENKTHIGWALRVEENESQREEEEESLADEEARVVGEVNPKLHWKNWSSLGKAKIDGGLGFRDFHSFNLALLAKQCWRLIQEPHSFWAKVLKARYFPLCDFAVAEKGYRASWSWASILEARDIILSGSRWQLGNGLSIRIWDDAWLPPPHNGVISTVGSLPSTAPVVVNQLVDWNSYSWNLGSISPFVSPELIQLISLIPIGDVAEADRLIWPWNTNGSYSVKSGYHWYHSRNARSLPNNGHTSHLVSSNCWKFIWKLKVLPKIKFFFWKALSNAIPSFLNLFRSKLNKNPLCPICHSYEESVEHILLLCPWVETVWFGSPLGYKIDKNKITTFDNWLLEINRLTSLSGVRCCLLSMVSFICWHIWKSRCSFVYQGCPLSPRDTLTRALSSLHEYLDAHSTSTLPAVSTMTDVYPYWSPPPVSMIKINCDATWDPVSSSAGYGVIARNHLGHCIGGLAKPSSCASALIAECFAILEGVSLAKDLSLSRVLVTTDSKEIINCIQNPLARGNWRIYPILIKIRRVAGSFEEIHWEWTPREANRAAHAAASLATRVVDLYRLASVPPPSLTRVLRNDGLPCPPQCVA